MLMKSNMELLWYFFVIYLTLVSVRKYIHSWKIAKSVKCFTLLKKTSF